MTRYEQGFMNKCAEYGVDEKSAGQLLDYTLSGLDKSAQAPGMLSRLLSKGMSFASKYGKKGLAAAKGYGKRGLELLRGGNAGILDPYHKQMAFLQKNLEKLNPSSKLYKADLTQIQNGFKKVQNAISGTGPIFESKFGDIGTSVGNELRKVRNARIGAGAAGAAGLGLIANGIHNQMGPNIDDFDYSPMKSAAAEDVKDDLSSAKGNLSSALDKIRNGLKDYNDFASADYANNVLVPGLVGGGLAGLASKYLDPSEDPRKKRRNRAILTLLGITGGAALKYKGKLDSLPKVSTGDGSITVSKK